MLKNRYNILSDKIKKPIKKSSSNQSQIKQAYELVTKDLLVNLKKAKDGAIIKIGEVGTFQKKISRVRNTYGVYRYYRINFQASKVLKKELDE
ncbi:MAG: hypothetical protein MRERV_1c126 [Mycoplasmataceae bacterium RV_VA103A]|nr:MAG: hypothetical protein MRERV_1c126 [Mycoplasmataceae bacterium RV_VA103A]